METPVEYMYRYKDITYSRGCTEWDDPLPGYTLRVELFEYRILSRTAKGVWIADGFIRQEYIDGAWVEYQPKKFVLLTARKKFACLTKSEALESFKARKRCQISFLSKQMNRAEQAIKLADTPERSYTQF